MGTGGKRLACEPDHSPDCGTEHRGRAGTEEIREKPQVSQRSGLDSKLAPREHEPNAVALYHSTVLVPRTEDHN